MISIWLLPCWIGISHTYMPPGGAQAADGSWRPWQKSPRRKFIAPGLGRLLDDLLPYEESQPYDSDDASLIRISRRDYELATKVSTKISGPVQCSRSRFLSGLDGGPARPTISTGSCLFLKKTLDLSRQFADFFPGYEHIADPLINASDYGVKASRVHQVFADLRARLVPMVKAITSGQEADDIFLHARLPGGAAAEIRRRGRPADRL